MLLPSFQPKDSASPTSLRNTIRCSTNSERKATSMPSSSLAASSTRSMVSGVRFEVRSEEISESLVSCAAALAWSSTITNLLSIALALPPPRGRLPSSRAPPLCPRPPTDAKGPYARHKNLLDLHILGHDTLAPSG